MTNPEPVDAFARTPDGYQRLWTPHRMAYIDGESKPVTAAAGDCPFCQAPTKPDQQGLIVKRGIHVYAVMNLFPYSPGHLLICPYRHVGDLTQLTSRETAELTRLTQAAMKALRVVSNPSGFNLGMNQGAVAGAGIAAHLHQHVVPRWAGDSNFLPIIAQTKALPELLEDTRSKLAATWG
ncbi:MAG: HIT domain-containing protein [Propionibacteriaceae bacterium]|nr:HIT domain-containing protein [Propionibacteriaceae bacterium]